MALPKNRGDREYEKFVEDASGDVAVRTALVVKDIAIGAVEIKDHTTDNRVHVTASKEITTINPALALLVGEVQATPTANTVLSRLKTIADAQLADGHNVTVDNVIGAGVYVRPGSGASWAVTGTFYQVTQPVSIAASAAVTGTFWQTTQPVSLASIPIAATAATSAKQLADGHNVAVDKIGEGTIVHATVNITASGASDIIATAASGHHYRIKAFSISSNDAADSEVEIRDGASAKFKFNIPKDGGNVVVNLVGANWDLTAVTALTANTAGATDLHINVSYEDITD